MSRTLLKRAVAAATALGLAGAASLALAPAAGAADVGGLSGVGTSSPTVVNGSEQAAAGNVEVSSTNVTNVGQTITLQVAPPTGAFCTPSQPTRNVSFATKPTASGPFTVSTAAKAGCNVENQVVLTATASVPANTKVTISNITYKIGDAVSRGPIRLGLSGADPVAAFSNAKVARVDRFAGADRYATAVSIAGTACTAAADRTPIVTIVSGENFPDALAASYLGYPILLVRKDSVPGITAAALEKLGAEQVVVVGGPQAVAPSVLSAISGIDVGSCGNEAGVGKIKVLGRLAGQTRYDTARAVSTSNLSGAAGTFSRALVPGGTCNAIKTAIVVSGENFPDALAAGALAAGGSKSGCGSGHLPLLLTRGTQLSPEVQESLLTNGIKQVIVVGGVNAVSGEVFGQIAEMDSIDHVARVSGKTRQDTAAELADLLITVGGYGGQALLVSGQTFPDALVAGAPGGFFGFPIILARTSTDLGPTATAFITDTTQINGVTIVGGPTAMSEAVANSVRDAFRAR